MKTRTYTVKDAARLSGVSVRTLHHYDEIGLLCPERTRAGYRLYDEAALMRLQQILIGRALGLSLEEIRASLDDPKFDHAAALERQRAALVQKLTQTHAMIASIDSALAHLQRREKDTAMKDIFNGFDPEQHVRETQERWGETDAYRESPKRTKRYGETEWRAIKAEADSIWRDGAALMAQGVEPNSAAARVIAERHRRHIDRWFYPCSEEMHAALADLWEADARFAANIDAHGEGLTPWIAQAVHACATND